MRRRPVQDSRLLKYASVTPSSDSGAPFVIKGVDIWDTHAVIYGEVIDPDSCLDYSRPTRIQFDFEPFEVGPLTVIPGPLPSIVFATARPPDIDAERIAVQYDDVEFKGIIAPGERP